MQQLDYSVLEHAAATHPRLLVLCPRRSGKTTFLAHYIDNLRTSRVIYVALTGTQCREFARMVMQPITTVTSIRHLPLHRAQAAELIALDEALFLDPTYLAEIMLCDRPILAMSTQVPDAQTTTLMMALFAASGFTVLDLTR